MAKARSTETKLARLHALRGSSAAPELLQELGGYLRDASNHVVAAAAELVAAIPYPELVPDLVAAYERFLDDPLKKDKLCRAKIALIEALNKLEFTDEAFYRRGIRYVQLEPAWGEPEDSAIPIRVASAFALVRLRHRGVLHLLVDLLAEKDKAARVGAVQALAYAGTEAAGLLLRLKARLGDAEPEVLSECFTGLLELIPDEGFPFVAEFLHRPEEAVQEAALLALGSSRQAKALEPLRAFAQRHTGDVQETALVALALLRLPAATEFLLALLADPAREVVRAVVKALAVHAHDPAVRERVAAAVAAREDAVLRVLFEKRFGPKA